MMLCRKCHDIGHPRRSRRDPLDTRHCYSAHGYDVVCGRCKAAVVKGRMVYDCHHYDFRGQPSAEALTVSGVRSGSSARKPEDEDEQE